MTARGEIWWAELGTPLGSEPAYTRPVLVLQADAYNRSRLSTVIVVALTSNLSRANDPGNVLVRSSESGLDRHSVVNVTQILTIDRAHLTRRVGPLAQAVLNRVEDGVRRILAL